MQSHNVADLRRQCLLSRLLWRCWRQRERSQNRAKVGSSLACLRQVHLMPHSSARTEELGSTLHCSQYFCSVCLLCYTFGWRSRSNLNCPTYRYPTHVYILTKLLKPHLACRPQARSVSQDQFSYKHETPPRSWRAPGTAGPCFGTCMRRTLSAVLQTI